MKQLILSAGLILAFISPAIAADPQKFKTEESATKFCDQGNVVWFNPASKIFFEKGSQFYAKTKAGGYTCRAFAEKGGFHAQQGAGKAETAGGDKNPAAATATSDSKKTDAPRPKSTQ